MRSDQILTTASAAKIAGISVSSMVRACGDGQIKYFRTPGGHRRIHLADLREYMATRKD